MIDAHSIANGNRTEFLGLYKWGVETPVRTYPDMLDKWWWKNPDNIIKLNEFRFIK